MLIIYSFFRLSVSVLLLGDFALVSFLFLSGLNACGAILSPPAPEMSMFPRALYLCYIALFLGDHIPHVLVLLFIFNSDF